MYKGKIIVTGIGGNVGQGILRNIKDAFPELFLIGLDTSDFTSANYLCDATYKVPFALDQNYTSSINEILIKEQNVKLIIPSTDFEAVTLAINYKKINCKIIASEANILKIYLDKYITFLHHSKLGIPFAKSWLPSEYDFSQNEIIAKPRKGRGSRSIIINPQNPQNFNDEYIIQPLLIGKEITTSIYVDKKNNIHGIFTMERQLQNGTTIKGTVISDFNKIIKNIAQKMIDFGGLRGCFNIQSIVNKDGLVIPFEINCRVSGTNSIRHNLGFKDVKYLIQEYYFNEIPDKPKPIYGVATRILLDVIYPNIKDAKDLINNKHSYIIY
tara:strand:- start:242 stop:1222 length:981 start_codon:yes stop_codon:yes gene_type:complete